MDSEVVVKEFIKGVQKKDEKNYMQRPEDQVVENVIQKDDEFKKFWE
jgi:hypothetical protein